MLNLYIDIKKFIIYQSNLTKTTRDRLKIYRTNQGFA